MAPEKVKAIYSEVASQLKTKGEQAKEQKEEEALVSEFNDQVADILAKQNLSMQQEQVATNLQYRNFIRKQIDENKARKDAEREYYKNVGVEEGGLLSGFGKSYR